ncbi:MAG: sigma-54-dependent Fis family transcriptional regulator, partial [candidate division Zixibacteria bacterium]|nr:sigma-54-dependent Fis family transcriptional regulator [candidate division Zixibacteria bacterium]
FGYEKGAFTGAIALKRGRFELADSGTIFLDEIGETSWALQTKLLRALEERVITRVGGTEDLKVDVRVIAATNRNLQKEIAAGNFREDLFFRLNVFPIAMPSLAERREDIPEFIRFFLVANKRSPNDISPKAVAKLKSYSWPGNVRELRNTIERAVILAGAGKIDSKHITLSAVAPAESSSAKSEPSGLEESERKMILQALNKCANNKTEAAKMLGITRRRLYSRIKFHNI